MSAGKGPRVRPYDGTSVARSTSGGLSARATGTKGFGMLGHTGSHGRSMVARVRGAGGDGFPAGGVCCYDFYDRTIAVGWEPETTWIGLWHPSDTSKFSVNGSAGVVDGTLDTTAWAEWGGGLGATYPGEVRLRLRRAGTEGDPGTVVSPWDGTDRGMIFRLLIADDDTDVWGDTGTVGVALQWTLLSGGYLQAGDVDARTAPSGGTQDWASRNIYPLAFADLWDWWNVRFYIDRYGTYTRVWKGAWGNTAAEFGYLASSQPTAPAGRGESWTTWHAYDVPRDLHVEDPTRLWLKSYDLEQVGATMEFDAIETALGLCVGCGITDTFSRTVAVGWGTTTGNVAIAWSDLGGSSVDGTAGLITIDTGATGMGQALAWTPPVTSPDPAMDIRIVASLNRALAGGTGWGEWIAIQAGDIVTSAVYVYLSGVEGISVEYDGGTTAWAAFPVDLTQEFILRIVCAGPASLTSVYLWPSTETQPSTPTFTFTADSYRNRYLSFYMDCDNASLASPLTLRVESIDVDGSEYWL